MILVVPRMLASITDPHLPLFQRTAIAFRMFVFSVSFVVPSIAIAFRILVPSVSFTVQSVVTLRVGQLSCQSLSL